MREQETGYSQDAGAAYRSMDTQSNDAIPDIASCDTCNLNRSGGLEGRHFHFTKPLTKPTTAEIS